MAEKNFILYWKEVGDTWDLPEFNLSAYVPKNNLITP